MKGISTDYNLIGGGSLRHFVLFLHHTALFSIMETATVFYWCFAIVFLLLLRRLMKRKVIDLRGQKVLITGAASGIGRMLAQDMVKKVTVRAEVDCREQS